VTEGLTGQGYTVAAGTTAVPFDAEVTGVLADGIAPGVHLIVAELASPELTDDGGVWAGMSGSPVYVDGQLMGAVAYGFSVGPSTLAGITPAEHLVELLNRGEVPAAADTEITVPPPCAGNLRSSSTFRSRRSPRSSRCRCQSPQRDSHRSDGPSSHAASNAMD
jgi:hypothetical protein